MANDEETLKIMVIGNDNILRSGAVSKSERFAFQKYRIDPDAIFLTEEYQGRLKGTKYVPTIAFYENNPEPIKRVEAEHDPAEIGDAISLAAWSLAKLIIERNEKFETFVYIMLIAGVILGGASAGLGYANYDKLKKIESGVNGLGTLLSSVQQNQNQQQQYVPTPTGPTGPVAPTPTVTAQPTPNLPLLVPGAAAG